MNSKTREEELDDMGVLVLNDECNMIEQVVIFFQYCIPISVVIVIVCGITLSII